MSGTLSRRAALVAAGAAAVAGRLPAAEGATATTPIPAGPVDPAAMTDAQLRAAVASEVAGFTAGADRVGPLLDEQARRRGEQPLSEWLAKTREAERQPTAAPTSARPCSSPQRKAIKTMEAIADAEPELVALLREAVEWEDAAADADARGDENEYDRLDERSCDALRRFWHTPARTAGGLAAKLRYAVDQSIGPLDECDGEDLETLGFRCCLAELDGLAGQTSAAGAGGRS